MHERRSMLETFFFFKNKGDKAAVITIPHLFFTWPLPPLLAYIQSAPTCSSNCKVGRLFSCVFFSLFSFFVCSFCVLFCLFILFFPPQRNIYVFMDPLCIYVHALGMYTVSPPAPCLMQAEERCQQWAPMTPNSALAGCPLPPVSRSLTRAPCFISRESIWQPTCLRKARTSLLQPGSGCVESASMCRVLFICLWFSLEHSVPIRATTTRAWICSAARGEVSSSGRLCSAACLPKYNQQA